jgi:hypothetical protein
VIRGRDPTEVDVAVEELIGALQGAGIDRITPVAPA